MWYLKFILLVLVGIGIQTAVFAQLHQNLPANTTPIPSSNEQWEQEVLTMVNQVRKRRGMKPLVLHPELSRVARYHAQDMATDDYFEHDSYDRVNGRKKRICSFTERLNHFSETRWFGWAENIAMGHTSSQSVMAGWMRSKGHRVNILNSDYRYIGIAFINGYWVQTFGA